MTTELALKRFVTFSRQEPYSDLRQYCRHFTAIIQNIEDAGGAIATGRKVKLLLQGLPSRDMEKVVRRLRINPLQLHQVEFQPVLAAVMEMGGLAASIRMLQTSEVDQSSVDKKVNEWRQPQRVLLPIGRQILQPLPRLSPDKYFPPHGAGNAHRPLQPTEASQHAKSDTERLTEQFRKLRLDWAALFSMISGSPLGRTLDMEDFIEICAGAAVQPTPASLPTRSQPPNLQDRAAHVPRAMPVGQYHGNNVARACDYQRPPLQCHCCAQDGHGYRSCPELEKLIRHGLIHFASDGLLHFGTAANPGDALPRLPPTNRLLKIREILGIADDGSNVAQRFGVTSISLQRMDGADQDSDEERIWTSLDGGVAAVRTQQDRQRDADRVSRDARVHKPQRQAPRLRTERDGMYVPDHQTLPTEPSDMHMDESQGPAAPNPRGPRAQRLPDILGKHETDESSLRIVQKLLNAPVTVI